jgi:TP901 family phage tail tape measure protein
MQQAAATTKSVRGEMGQLTTVARRNSEAFTTAGIAIGAAGAAITIGLKKAGDEAAQFESKLTKSTTLIGISREEMQKMGQAALRLSDTGQGPQALADALFFVQSAGLRGSEALSVVEASAKASSIGLGETAMVADLVTSAVNAYGIENLSAAAATDTLIGVVREGKAEAPELAGALGRVLPIASEMGVRFDEVGASVASMTRTGSDAATATTQLRAILVSLLKPAQQSEGALEELGLSSAMLRDTIRRDGLWAALELLRGSIGDNEEALGKIFPNVRALAGFLDLTGANAESTAEIFGNMADTTGLLAEGFAEWSLTTEASQMRFSAAMEAARISLGEGLQKPMKAALDTGTGLAQMFIELPGPMRDVVALGGGVAGVGLTMAGGFLLAAPRIAATKIALADLAVTMPRTVGLVRGLGKFMMGPLGLALGAATLATLVYAKAKGESEQRIKAFTEAIQADTGALGENTRQLVINELQQRDALTTAERLGISRGDLVNALLGEEGAYKAVDSQLLKVLGSTHDLDLTTREGNETYQQRVSDVKNVRDALVELGPELSQSSDNWRAEAEAAAEAEGLYLDVAHAIKNGLSPEAAEIRIRMQEYRAEAEAAEGATGELGGGFEDLTEGIDETDEALTDYLETLRKATDPVFALESALSDVEAAQTDYNDAVEEYGPKSDEAREASFRLMQRLEDLERAAIDGDLSFEDFSDKLDHWVKRGDITKEQADSIRGRVKDLRKEAEDYQDDYNAEFTETGIDDVMAKVKNLGSAILELPSGRKIRITAEGVTSGGVFAAQGGPINGPGSATSDSIPAWLSDGEFVMKAAARAKYGDKLMAAVNAGMADVSLPGMGGPTATVIGNADKLRATDFSDLMVQTAAKQYASSFSKGRVLPRGSYRIGMPYLGYPGHLGADYPAPRGTPIYAMAAGRASRAFRMATSYGIHAFLDHPGGVQTRYAHMSALNIGYGQAVGKGQMIGRVGSTGNSTGDHLHFEYRKNGSPVNPASLGIFDDGGILAPGHFGGNTATRPDYVFSESQWNTLSSLASRGADSHLTGNLYLSTGEFLGVVDGRISSKQSVHDRDLKRRARAGAGLAR